MTDFAKNYAKPTDAEFKSGAINTNEMFTRN